MNRRDEFAIRCLSALMSDSQTLINMGKQMQERGETAMFGFAKVAASYADALIAELDRTVRKVTPSPLDEIEKQCTHENTQTLHLENNGPAELFCHDCGEKL